MKNVAILCHVNKGKTKKTTYSGPTVIKYTWENGVLTFKETKKSYAK